LISIDYKKAYLQKTAMSEIEITYTNDMSVLQCYQDKSQKPNPIVVSVEEFVNTSEMNELTVSYKN